MQHCCCLPSFPKTVVCFWNCFQNRGSEVLRLSWDRERPIVKQYTHETIYTWYNIHNIHCTHGTMYNGCIILISWMHVMQIIWCNQLCPTFPTTMKSNPITVDNVVDPKISQGEGRVLGGWMYNIGRCRASDVWRVKCKLLEFKLHSFCDHDIALPLYTSSTPVCFFIHHHGRS